MARKKNLASYIDHTLLKPDATQTDIDRLCDEAAAFNFAAVCIPPSYVSHAAERLKGKKVAIATVVGFPLGYSTTNSKLVETKKACKDGATEIDMVINLTWVRNQEWNKIGKEIKKIAKYTHSRKALLKVIIETALLTEDDIIKLCDICANAKADYVKTSTGFNGSGATVEIVTLMRKILPLNVKIKASGGIRSYETARDLVNAGADRLGSSSSADLMAAKIVEAATSSKSTKKKTSRQTKNTTKNTPAKNNSEPQAPKTRRRTKKTTETNNSTTNNESKEV
ncbi:MAG: deoxyribose-phosphate aldolase [Chitinophagales bacterium]|jgi:deoxyribose-phosphate aldolase|nr:deoxyribose-phosphate aldolase [Chitinophagales bacterium]HNI43311.1 deoxyribose-phosphate aldolase [Chitinophagales bacterium]